MRFEINLLVLFVSLTGVHAQVKDGCPKNEIACLDIINSSQCIEQLVFGPSANITQDAMIQCVVTPGVSSSNLPGATKVSSGEESMVLDVCRVRS